jgi:hypothetical protein
MSMKKTCGREKRLTKSDQQGSPTEINQKKKKKTHENIRAMP